LINTFFVRVHVCVCACDLQYNTAFSEDTQRGTDRLIRAVVQDLTELDRETSIKAGKTRADTKVRYLSLQ
jgi:transposase